MKKLNIYEMIKVRGGEDPPPPPPPPRTGKPITIKANDV